jgi:nucleoside-diphosphate-sugar epimerase
MALVELDKLKSIYIAGHMGMVGSALLRKFKKVGFKNIIVIVIYPNRNS